MSQDPFSDPFSPEPAPPAPSWGPPAGAHPPPPPAPSTASVRTQPAREATGLSPATVFFGSYVFAGIAALLLAAAIAVLVAISDFRSHGSAPGPLLVATAAGLIVVAALVVSLAVLTDRGHSWARIVTWGACALGLCTGVAVFILDPGESVAWFGQLLHVGAVVAMIISVASAVLLGLPESSAYLRPGSRPEPAAAPAFPQPTASPAPSGPRQPPPPPQRPAGSTPPPRTPANDPDYDPFS